MKKLGESVLITIKTRLFNPTKEEDSMEKLLRLSIVTLVVMTIATVACADNVQDGIDRLKNGNKDIREEAAEYLGSVGAGNQAVQSALIEAMTDPVGDVRESAAKALGKVGDTDAVPVLIRALKDDDFGVRNAAVKALGSVGDERAVDPLQEVAANAWNPFVSKEASKSIMQIKARTGN